MRIGEPIVEAVDAVGEDVGSTQPFEPTLGCVTVEDRAYDVAKFGRMRGACSKIGKPGILRQIGPSERDGEPGELLLAHQRHHDPAITRPVGAGRHIQLPRCAAFEPMFGELMAEDRRSTLCQADLEPLAFATALACVECY